MPLGERVWLRRSVLLLVCAWPLALHSAIQFASPHWSIAVNTTAIAMCLAIWAIAASKRSARIAALALTALLAVIFAVAPQILLLAPPVLINGALAAVFAASLRPGREPVIAVFARLEQGKLQPDLAQHARFITWLWTLLLAGIATTSLALAILASTQAWSMFTNVVSYVLIAILFVGEYLYRKVRFRHYRHATLPEMMRNVRRANLFARR
jgi:uncharacterized membrane protein